MSVVILHDMNGEPIHIEADDVSEYSELPGLHTNSEVRLNNGDVFQVRENMVQIEHLLENAWSLMDDGK